MEYRLQLWKVRIDSIKIHFLLQSLIIGFDQRRVCYELGVPIKDYSVCVVISMGYQIDQKDGDTNDQIIQDLKAIKREINDMQLPSKVRFPLESICYEDWFGHPISFDNPK